MRVLRDEKNFAFISEDVDWDGRNGKQEPVASGLYIFYYTHREKVQYAKVSRDGPSGRHSVGA